MCGGGSPSLGIPKPPGVTALSGLPNPIPALGVPGVILPKALQGTPPGGGSGYNPNNPRAQAPSNAEKSILGLLGRGTLDTTILGQNRSAASTASAARYNTSTLGG